MKILVVADTQVPEFADSGFNVGLTKGVELIISCGDLQPEYLSLLSKQIGVPVYYVMGNHDIRYEVAPPEGCLNIHRQIITYGGVRILGLGAPGGTMVGRISTMSGKCGPLSASSGLACWEGRVRLILWSPMLRPEELVMRRIHATVVFAALKG